MKRMPRGQILTFDDVLQDGLHELTGAVINNVVLKQIVSSKLNANLSGNSLIDGGIDKSALMILSYLRITMILIYN